MEQITGTSPIEKRPRRDWINPLRLYDPRIPAGRFAFLWGVAIYPLLVMFVLETAIIIFIETVYPNSSTDYLGVIVYVFMLAWVMATVAITRRRLLDLRMSQNWVWVVIFPIINLPLVIYLLLKPSPAA